MHSAIGIGLRPPHYDAMLSTLPAVGWLEVHSENYFEPHSRAFAVLSALAEHYPVSLHGIGMSLGSSDPLDPDHLARLRSLVASVKPVRVSEHLSWGSVDGRYFNDLLPMPCTRAALARMSDKVKRVQDLLGRELLIENPSSYLQFEGEMPEWEFLARLQQASGCGILLDLNNLHVSAFNQGFSCADYLAAIDLDTVKEIHLAGFTDKVLPEGHLYIDTHSCTVADPVWALYRALCAKSPRPTLIEWDSEIPALPVLIAEADKASLILEAALAEGKELSHV